MLLDLGRNIENKFTLGNHKGIYIYFFFKEVEVL